MTAKNGEISVLKTKGCAQFVISPFAVLIPVPLFSPLSCFTALSYWKEASCCILYMQQNAFINIQYQCTAVKVRPSG